MSGIIAYVFLFTGYAAAVWAAYGHPLFVLAMPPLTVIGIKIMFHDGRKGIPSSLQRANGYAAAATAVFFGPAAFVSWLVARDISGVGLAEAIFIAYAAGALVYGTMMTICVIAVLFDLI